VVRSFEIWLGLVAMKGGYSCGCLLFRDSVVVTEPSVRGSINDPTGYFWRTRIFENKHEEEGVVNWKLLPAGVGNQWVGFATRRSGDTSALVSRHGEGRFYLWLERGLNVSLRVPGIFTGTPSSPSNSFRQSYDRYAIRAGRNLPDKEFRYL